MSEPPTVSRRLVWVYGRGQWSQKQDPTHPRAATLTDQLALAGYLGTDNKDITP